MRVHASIVAAVAATLGILPLWAAADPTSLDAAPIALTGGWSMRPGDDLAWAKPELDTTGWTPAGATDQLETRREIVWLRRWLEIAPRDRGREVTVSIDLRGSLTLFVDGREQATIGSPGGRAASSRQHRVTTVRLPEAERALLAVRFDPLANRGVDWMEPTGGFRLTFGSGPAIAELAETRARLLAAHQMAFVGMFLGQAVLHLLLFLFYRRYPSNLYFSMTAASAAALVGLHFERALSSDAVWLALAGLAWGPLLVLTNVLLLRFVYEVFDQPRRLAFWTVVLLGLAIAVVVVWRPEYEAFVDFWWWPLLALAEMVRVTWGATRRGWPGARIIGAGLITLMVGLAWQALLILADVWQPAPIFPVAYYGVTGLLFSVSVYLAFHFARLGRTLREQLDQVEELSARTLAQELEAKEREVERRLLEADNRRKTEELESARALQLSLLPSELPRLDHLELAVSMETATEVGGDYYDFRVEDERTLLLAIGDAPGHGVRAGTVVPLMKGMFSSLAQGAALGRFLQESNGVVRALEIDGLTLALAVARLEGREMTLSAAGMPPALVHRAATGGIEELLVAGMPLGGLPRSRYTESRVGLGLGDTLLLMSDGFPELLDAHGDPLGYEAVQSIFAACVHLSAEQIIAHLRQAVRERTRGEPPADDVTFTVLRLVAEPPAPRARVRFGM